MATKSKRPAEKPPSGGKFSFVRFELTAPELRQVKEWKPTLDELDEIVASYNEKDYRISLSYDDYNSCHQAMMVQKFQNGPNWNLGLVGRGSSPIRALKQLFWKDKSCDHVWPVPDHTQNSQKEFDD